MYMSNSMSDCGKLSTKLSFLVLHLLRSNITSTMRIVHQATTGEKILNKFEAYSCLSP